jgi:hypothetical protein
MSYSDKRNGGKNAIFVRRRGSVTHCINSHLVSIPELILYIESVLYMDVKTPLQTGEDKLSP